MHHKHHSIDPLALRQEADHEGGGDVVREIANENNVSVWMDIPKRQGQGILFVDVNVCL